MEIERKFLVRSLPEQIDRFPHEEIVQAYISTNPVIRIRRKGDRYILTVKSSGLLAREETEMDISPESFLHLMTKTEGIPIEKTRYRIPERDGLVIELDLFRGVYEGFIMAEVEFKDMEEAYTYLPPDWFGKEVTEDPDFHNSGLSRRSQEQVGDFLHKVRTLS